VRAKITPRYTKRVALASISSFLFKTLTAQFWGLVAHYKLTIKGMDKVLEDLWEIVLFFLALISGIFKLIFSGIFLFLFFLIPVAIVMWAFGVVF